MSIRNAAKAVILQENKILLNKCSDALLGEYYDLPGGGQQPYERMEDAVRRECLEETGYSIAIDRFLAMGEEIYDHPQLQVLYPDYTHRIYHIFQCHITDAEVREAVERDYSQVSCEWVEIGEVGKINIYPRALRNSLATILETGVPRFLGTDFVFSGGRFSSEREKGD